MGDAPTARPELALGRVQASRVCAEAQRGQGAAGPRAQACIITGPPLWAHGASAPEALPAARGLLTEVHALGLPPPAP